VLKTERSKSVKTKTRSRIGAAAEANTLQVKMHHAPPNFVVAFQQVGQPSIRFDSHSPSSKKVT
jgi:hypothetical protein